MKEIVLTGLDGQNPLGFLAALGLIRVLDDDAASRGVDLPTIAYASIGEAIPTLTSDLDLDTVIALVLEDAKRQADNRALQFAYTPEGERVPPTHADAICDLKPPPKLARELLKEAAVSSRRVSGLVAGWFTELIRANNGNTKPTSLHFTAGQQVFLSMVENLRRDVSPEDVREALLGPWMNASALPSLSWDSSATRYYALRANKPSDEKRGSVPGANWLAALALEFFPVVAHGQRLVTTGVRGGWKDSVFRWPIWEARMTRAAIASLVRVDPRRWAATEREAIGIIRVYAASILRADPGGSGSFSPADVVLPMNRSARY